VTDPVVAAAGELVGGPPGRYAVAVPAMQLPMRRVARTTAALAAAATALPLGLAALIQSHCLRVGWDTPDQFFHMCFSDLTNSYRDAVLTDGLPAYLGGGPSAPVPAQPPLTGLIMTALASALPDGSELEHQRGYLLVWGALIAVLLASTAALCAMTTWWAPRRAFIVALSPVVALVALVSPDALGVVCVAGALYAWSRSRPGWAGVLLGVGISARTYPLLVLFAVLVLCLRAGQGRVARQVAMPALLLPAVIFGALLALNAEGALAAVQAWASGGAGFGSPWVLPMLAGFSLPTSAVLALAVIGWVAALVVGTLLALGAPQRPPVWEVAAVVVGVALVTGTSFPVQSSLWLVPLLALVGLSWRDLLIWSGAEALHWGAVWLHIAAQSESNRGLPGSWYAVLLLVRLAAVLWVVRQTWVTAMRRRVVDPQEPVEADELTADGATAERVTAERVSAVHEQGPLAMRPDRLVVALR
jgi:hypothetical protein